MKAFLNHLVVIIPLSNHDNQDIPEQFAQFSLFYSD